jgi:hypothetical protein
LNFSDPSVLEADQESIKVALSAIFHLNNMGEINESFLPSKSNNWRKS